MNGCSLRCAWVSLAFMMLLAGCGRNPSSEPSFGEQLAAIACAQCHTVPPPSLLSREEWPYVLAWMGNYLGRPPEIQINTQLVARCFLPPQPILTVEQFNEVRKHYLEQSAGQYKIPPPAPAPPASSLFEIVSVTNQPEVISLVAIDPVDRAVVIGSSRPPGLLISRGNVQTSLEVPSEPVTFERRRQVHRVALIGDLGRDARRGQIVDFDAQDGTRQVLVDSHPRIAAHASADVDGDGKDDLLVCGFGDYPVGRVGIWWGGEEKRTEQILLEEPGAAWGDLADLDGDGDLDVVLAIGSNRPRLLAFVNEGNRRLAPRVIVERPVGWGYNRCQLVDWDGDRRLDIVELAGNNLELGGRPLKPWHGVRVLHNDGNWKFHEVLFEPLPGAIDVAAGDFDGDGRVDLAVTAFYPDWRLPVPTTFLLLQQQADGPVKRAGLDERYWNRWMRIAAGDVDGDGDLDLLLGAADVPAGVPSEHQGRFQQMFNGKPTVLLLRNRTVP